MAEPDYAQVDMSKKGRNRRPVTDEYAEVDKSKKSKKPRKVYIQDIWKYIYIFDLSFEGFQG